MNFPTASSGKKKPAYFAYRDGWIPQADERGFLLAVPQFSEVFYPTSHDYNYGDMMTPDGRHRPRSEWLFPLVEQIVDALCARAGSRRKTFHLFGHSAGGQFLVRLAAFQPGSAVRIVAANPGSLLFPARDRFGPRLPAGDEPIQRYRIRQSK